MPPGHSDHRILFIHAAPLVNTYHPHEPIEVLDSRVERSKIRDALRSSNLNIIFRIVVGKTKKIAEALGKGAVFIHFSGHGARGCICLEDDYARVQPLDTEQLRGLLRASEIAEQGTKCAFVSSCHSESIGRAFLDAGVPNVIAIRHDAMVLESTCEKFADSFYSFLLLNKNATISKAFEMALQTVEIDARHDMSPRPRELFLLLQHDPSADENPFASASTGHHVDETANSCVAYHRSPPPNFFDREKQMQTVYSEFANLTSSCAVVITGKRGIGKSALANSCAEYMHERSLFDFIFFVPFREGLEAGQLQPDADKEVLFTFIRDNLGAYKEGISTFDELKDILNGRRQFPYLRSTTEPPPPLLAAGGGGAASSSHSSSSRSSSTPQYTAGQAPRVLFVFDDIDEFAGVGGGSSSFTSVFDEDLIMFSVPPGAHAVVTSPADSLFPSSYHHQQTITTRRSHRPPLTQLINELLQLNSAHICFLATSCHSIDFHLDHALQKIVRIDKLSDTSMARLLGHSFHRPLASCEIGAEPDRLLSLSTSSVISQELHGHPGALMAFLGSDAVRGAASSKFNANSHEFILEARRAYAIATAPRPLIGVDPAVGGKGRGGANKLNGPSPRPPVEEEESELVPAVDPDDLLLQDLWMKASIESSHRHHSSSGGAVGISQIAGGGGADASGQQLQQQLGRPTSDSSASSAELSRLIRYLEQFLFSTLLPTAFQDKYPLLTGGDLSDGRVAWTSRTGWSDQGVRFIRAAIDIARSTAATATAAAEGGERGGGGGGGGEGGGEGAGVDIHDLDPGFISASGFNRFKDEWLRPLIPILRAFSLELTSLIRPREIHGIAVNCETADERLVSPVILGFLLRSEAEGLLQRAVAPGVFIIRFRDSSCTSLAISYTESSSSSSKKKASKKSSPAQQQYSISHTAVDVDQQGRLTLVLEGGKRTYNSLRYLLAEAPRLQTLYPHTPKEVVIKWLERFT